MRELVADAFLIVLFMRAPQLIGAFARFVLRSFFVPYVLSLVTTLFLLARLANSSFMG